MANCSQHIMESGLSVCLWNKSERIPVCYMGKGRESKWAIIQRNKGMMAHNINSKVLVSKWKNSNVTELVLGKIVRYLKFALDVFLSAPLHFPSSPGAHSGCTSGTAYSETPAHSLPFWKVWEAQGKQKELGTEGTNGYHKDADLYELWPSRGTY